ncbi:MAG TPA: hypothetical protein VMJ65_14700 [Solirubrobacteraceae bacterium]|nr:hypothetical protein [Solirubrobacteraceae bacterium]
MKRLEVHEETPAEEAYLGLREIDALGGERGADFVSLPVAQEAIEANTNDDVVAEGGAGGEQGAQLARGSRGACTAATLRPAAAHGKTDAHATVCERDAGPYTCLLHAGGAAACGTRFRVGVRLACHEHAGSHPQPRRPVCGQLTNGAS